MADQVSLVLESYDGISLYTIAVRRWDLLMNSLRKFQSLIEDAERTEARGKCDPFDHVAVEFRPTPCKSFTKLKLNEFAIDDRDPFHVIHGARIPL